LIEGRNFVKKSHLGLKAIAAGLLACSAAATTQAMPVEIEFRSFSPSAALQQPADDYAAKLKAITETVIPGYEVTFRRQNPTRAIPTGNILNAVSLGKANGGLDAAYTSGGDLNPTWGFLYNSGVPFGPTFDEYMGFLYGRSITDENGTHSGLALMEAILQAHGRNFVVIPVGGHTEQGSGYFKKPVGNVHGVHGIGLKGLCQEFWTFRYLPPAENVLDRACDNLVASGEIPVKNIKFIQAIPGGGSLNGAVKAGTIQAFEFASPWDDWSQVFLNPDGTLSTDNPGTLGLRFLHFPGWHQQYLITYMIVNKTLWDDMTDAQRTLLKSVGRDNVLTSYGDNLSVQGGFLAKILNANKNDANPGNDMVLTPWPKKDLELLREATIQFLNERAFNTSLPLADRDDYMKILEALRKFVKSNDLYWDVRQVPSRMRFEDWENPDGARWEDNTKKR
jgi:TRAP-type mannitol/chloroaromatic compound transport system substrate-binding protein